MSISSLNNGLLNGGSAQLTPSAGQNNKAGVVGALAAPDLNSLLPGTAVGTTLEERRQTALQVVNKTLTAAYEKLATRGQAASEGYAAFEPLTAEKVANNILGFIERRLQLDVADGASQEQLQARLEAGLSGFKTGFAEASEKLEALSLLSPEIKTDIGKTYDLVLEGIDQLRAKFIENTSPAKSTQPPAFVNSEQLSSNVSTAPVKLNLPDFIPSNPVSGYANYEYGRARQFNFELTTKEGDKVVISAASSEGLAVEAGRTGGKNGASSFLNASYSSASSFSLTIEGNLNENELVAINDLLGRVNELAGQFFAGNLDDAFSQAMTMDYDANQIGRFALDLAQAEIQIITTKNDLDKPFLGTETAPGLNPQTLLPMGNFIRDLLDSLERASVFSEPGALIASIGEKITGEENTDKAQGHRFGEFLRAILTLDLDLPE